MIRLIVFLAIAIALSLLATWLVDHPGRATLAWGGTHVETSLAVLVVGVLLLGVLLTILFEILRLIRGAPRRFAAHRRRSRTEKGHQALAQGLVAAAAGDTTAAKACNRRADRLLGHAPSTLLLSAQAAQLEGDEGAARLTFQEMLRHPETEFLGLRGLLAQAIKDGDNETALRLARRAYLRRPHTPWVLSTLFDLQTREGLWTEAQSTIGAMAGHKLIDRATATRRRAILLHQQAAAQRAAGRPYEALYLARKAHKLQPDLAPLAVQASALAEETNQPRVAGKVIEAAWQANPHPALAKAYLGLNGKASPDERLKVMERLYQLRPDQLESELALAEQAIAAKAWPVARTALERARKLGPTASVYRLLAEVAQAEGDGEQARAWLAQAVDAPPDRAWLCETNGEARASWSAFGPDGRFDSLRWGAPRKIVPLVGDEVAELIPPSRPRGTELVPVVAPEAVAAPVRPEAPVGPVRPAAPVRAAKVDAA
ncbi:MAG: heme biosynthesis protein HemY [Geminicoccaceae bacterium]